MQLLVLLFFVVVFAPIAFVYVRFVRREKFALYKIGVFLTGGLVGLFLLLLVSTGELAPSMVSSLRASVIAALPIADYLWIFLFVIFGGVFTLELGRLILKQHLRQVFYMGLSLSIVMFVVTIVTVSAILETNLLSELPVTRGTAFLMILVLTNAIGIGISWRPLRRLVGETTAQE